MGVLETAWHDSVWSKVIATIIGTVIISISVQVWKWPQRLWRGFLLPKLTMMGGYTDQSGSGYPLKYYMEFRNDSRGCVEVRVPGYEPNTITLKNSVLPPEVLQLRFNTKWSPEWSTDRVALLPQQMCRA